MENKDRYAVLNQPSTRRFLLQKSVITDCSQTLYEFRASKPKALNVLEGSGVFTAHQLQVNYRSTQEILDFANVALQNIEANQYAHIQLRANSLRQVTEKSFTDAVKFKYHRLAKLGDLKDRMDTIFANDLKPYIDDCLARGEHVAFLAFTRQTIALCEQHLESLYPNSSRVKLIPEKTYNTTIFSDFIRSCWDQVKFMPSKGIVTIITRALMDNLVQATAGKARAGSIQQKASNMLTGWTQQYGGAIAAWERQYVAGQLDIDEFLGNVRETMLSYEIAANAMKQALMSQHNREIKEANAQVDADFILSTIHSAKGLEFDNVVVIYRNDNTLEEDKKRMYYVAFTRAMHSEYIVAYDTVSSPAIETDYKTIVKNLHRIAPASASGNAQAVANAKAILAAQAAGRTDLAVSGQPAVTAVVSEMLDCRPVAYAKDVASPQTVNGMNLNGTQVFSKVPDMASAIAKAQALIDAMKAAADEEDERKAIGRKRSDINPAAMAPIARDDDEDEESA